MLIKSHRDIILTDQGLHLKEEQYRLFLETIYGQYLQQIFFLHRKCEFQKMKMHENEGGGLTHMLIKPYIDMILTDQRFHLKEEQYRQFLEPVYRQYLQSYFFLLEICLVRKTKIHENEGGGLTHILINPYRDMVLADQGFYLKEEYYRQFLEPVYREYLQQIFFSTRNMFGPKDENARK